MYDIGLIGIGYWGPNVARSMELTGRVCIRWLCDVNEVRTKALGRATRTRVTTNPQDVFKDPNACSRDCDACEQPFRAGYAGSARG